MIKSRPVIFLTIWWWLWWWSLPRDWTYSSHLMATGKLVVVAMEVVALIGGVVFLVPGHFPHILWQLTNCGDGNDVEYEVLPLQ